jgi:mRNA interferase MazF
LLQNKSSSQKTKGNNEQFVNNRKKHCPTAQKIPYINRGTKNGSGLHRSAAALILLKTRAYKMIKRGEIYYANLDPVVGSEQGGTRPCLVVQNAVGNLHSPTVIVTPLTKTIKKTDLPTHVLLSQACGLEADSLALAEQIRTLDKSRLGDYIGRVDMTAIDIALAISIGLEVCA